jgi:hypothetical protein
MTSGVIHHGAADLPARPSIFHRDFGMHLLSNQVLSLASLHTYGRGMCPVVFIGFSRKICLATDIALIYASPLTSRCERNKTEHG